ncbi:unnamed protein product [Clonostachys rhizophaga]|uniref:EthD domain-containing protein n=1 Tax=Clonostachys rhizophaga TaxID=160324 RepID=A0A9N9YS68_9HYPO|nr:unnamed protein product [Clonostachys rhizophaga]
MSTTTNTNTPNRVCSIAFLKKNPSLTHDEFYHHWSQVHGPLVKPWMEKHGITGYTQVNATPQLNDAAAATPLGPEKKRDKGKGGEDPLGGFDGAAVIEAPSWDVLEGAFADEYYRDVIAKDEERFLDRGAGVLRKRGLVNRVI